MTHDLRTELILRHGDRMIPRYTSYPTAPHFHAGVDDRTYAEWLQQVPVDQPVSLYLHVPFCQAMCWYCGCNTRVTRRSEPVETYIGLLRDEMNLVAAELPGRMTVRHLHWGGGSPSIMTPEQLCWTTDMIAQTFDLPDDAEQAMELDPRNLTPELVAAMALCGINRASLGVQTFDPDVQAAIGRVQPYDLVREATKRLRGTGISDINMDLLYGLPKQTTNTVRRTAEQVLTLMPRRISVFGYAHVPGMKAHQRLIDADILPDSHERLSQFEAIAEMLTDAGYVAIGLDHFAHPDDEMAMAHHQGDLQRNFQGYTTDQAPVLIGVGASAIGSLPQGYVQNAPDNARWQLAIRDGRLPTVRGRELTTGDRMRREIIERVMCDLRVDPVAIAARHGLPVPEVDLTDLERDGIIRRDGDMISLLPEFRPLARVVAAAFDAFLDHGIARHSIAV